MSSGPLFSVLLPTHNRADLVGLAIRSVLDQSASDLELLVVGDGCTDNTAAVVSAFDDPRVRWFDLPKAPNFGYANRNVAVRQARGELMAFMAHDDLWFPDHLALLGSRFNRDEVDWVYSRPLWIDDDGVMIPFALDLSWPDLRATFLTDHNSIPAGNVVYRRRCHEWAGYWPEDVPMGGDWALWKAIIGPSGGANLDYVRQPTALHFRAARNAGKRDWGPSPLPDWQDRARSEWWPQALLLEVPADTLPQEAAAAVLARRGAAWVREVRQGVPRLLEELAWRGAADVVEARRQMTEADRRVANLSERKAIAEANLVRERMEAAAVLAGARHEAAAARAEAVAARQAEAAATTRADRAEAELAELRRKSRSWLRGVLTRMGRRVLLRVRPNPRASGFDAAWYLAEYPDVAASGMSPLDHFYVYGELEGRVGSPPHGGAGAQPSA